MARTLFPDILSAYKLDIKNEIKKLNQLLFIDTIKISETLLLASGENNQNRAV